MPARFNSPPNWPTPPAGWTPPDGWRPDPAWGPAPEGWTWWVDDAPVPAAVQHAPVVQVPPVPRAPGPLVPAAPAGTPGPAVIAPQPTPVFRAAPVPPSLYAPAGRSTGVRVLALIGIVGGVAVVRWVVQAVGALIDGAVFGLLDPPPLFELLAVLAAQAAFLVALSWACPKVAHRRHDWLFALIPVYGWVWPLRIIWRVTNLPHRGWPERPDQLASTWWAGPAPLAPAPVPVGGAGRFGS